MTVALTSINTAADVWQVLINRVNSLIGYAGNSFVTVDGTANGSVSTGNGFVNGVFAAVTLGVGTLRGGNVQSSATLNVSSNVSVGNSTANVELGFGTIQVGSTLVNSSAFSVGANVSIDVGKVSLGNSTVNATLNTSSLLVTGSVGVQGGFSANATQAAIGATVANSSAVASGNAVLTGGAYVGANVVLSTTGLSVGNSTVNTNLTTSLLQIGATLSVNTSLFSLGNSTVNTQISSTGITTNTGAFGSLATVGGWTINATTLSIGNSTVFLKANSSAMSVNGLSVITAANRTAAAVGGAGLAISGILNFVQGTGVSVVISDDSPEGFVNVSISTTAVLANGAGGANTDVLFNDSSSLGGSGGFTFDKTTNNVVVANTLTINGSVKVGANVVQNTTVHQIGNSTVSFSTNSTLLQMSSGGASANLNANGFATGNTLANSTAISAQTQWVASTVRSDYVSFTTTGTTAQVVDTITVSARSAKYLVSIKDNNANGYQTSELLVLWDGSNSEIVEFGQLYSNALLGTFTTTANSTAFNVLFTPVSSNTTVKMHRTLMPT